MKMKYILISFICSLLTCNAQYSFTPHLRADCTNPSKSYCINEKQYVLCDGANDRESAIFSCPIDGQFCSHDDPSSCSSSTKTDNTQCGQCLTGATGHACLSMTSFKICKEGSDGEAEPAEAENFCPKGLYCDVYHPNRENPCRRYTGQQFLCWNEYKAPAPPTADDICANIAQEGNHEYEKDTDCTKFRACSKDESTGKWSGKIMTCPSNTFYDPLIRVCVPPVIYKCRKNPSLEVKS